MASYLVQSASTLYEGTDSNDTFLVQTALQNTVKGGAGNDVISAEENNVGSWTQALINGNDGNDTITFSAGTGANASILGGAGNDLLSAEGATLTATLFQAGGGTDSMNLSAGTYALVQQLPATVVLIWSVPVDQCDNQSDSPWRWG